MTPRLSRLIEIERRLRFIDKRLQVGADTLRAIQQQATFINLGSQLFDLPSPLPLRTQLLLIGCNGFGVSGVSVTFSDPNSAATDTQNTNATGIATTALAPTGGATNLGVSFTAPTGFDAPTIISVPYATQTTYTLTTQGGYGCLIGCALPFQLGSLYVTDPNGTQQLMNSAGTAYTNCFTGSANVYGSCVTGAATFIGNFPYQYQFSGNYVVPLSHGCIPPGSPPSSAAPKGGESCPATFSNPFDLLGTPSLVSVVCSPLMVTFQMPASPLGGIYLGFGGPYTYTVHT
jgi:hypothetical protein